MDTASSPALPFALSLSKGCLSLFQVGRKGRASTSSARTGLGILSLALLAACGEAETPVENNVAMDVVANAIEGEVTLAERLVREALDNPEALTFADPIRSRSDNVTIICGRYTRGEEPARRYIVVDNQDVFVEANMPQADMDASFAEFCTQGAQRPAQPAPPAVPENGQ